MSNSRDQDDNFAERLIRAREAREFSQTDLARAAGLQPAAVGHFENSRRKPSFANIRSLAKALQVSSDYLLGRSPDFEAATTAFRGEENLSKADLDHIQMMIDLMNQKKEKG